MTEIHEFWNPGEGVRDIYGRLAGNHVVVAGLFAGAGSTGVIYSRLGSVEFAVWDVDSIAIPCLRSVHSDRDDARNAFRTRVAELLADEPKGEKS